MMEVVLPPLLHFIKISNDKNSMNNKLRIKYSLRNGNQDKASYYLFKIYQIPYTIDILITNTNFKTCYLLLSRACQWKRNNKSFKS